MAKQTINIGTLANDKTGDTLRNGAVKINSNFTELYNILNSITTSTTSNGVTTTTLKTASDTVLGGIKIGNNLTITDGVLSATASGNSSNYTLPVATSNTLGGVKVDGSTITIDPTTHQISGFDGDYANLTNVPVIGTRTVLTNTTGSIANNGSAILNFSGYKGYALYKIETSVAAWVRIYVNSERLASDAARGIGTDPSITAGVIAEVVSTGNQVILIAPGVLGFNNESPVTNNIALSVTNISGNTANITVKLTIVPLEI